MINHAAALTIAKANAFHAYERAVMRKRDTARITAALCVLFIISAVWEITVNGEWIGPWWLILGFIGMGVRAINLSDTQVELARANLVAVSEMCDALATSMGLIMSRVDDRLTQLDVDDDEAYRHFHGTDPLSSEEGRTRDTA